MGYDTHTSMFYGVKVSADYEEVEAALKGHEYLAFTIGGDLSSDNNFNFVTIRDSHKNIADSYCVVDNWIVNLSQLVTHDEWVGDLGDFCLEQGWQTLGTPAWFLVTTGG